MAIAKVVYLHGYNSSELSHKAQICREWLAANHPSITFSAPRLPDNPDHIAPAIEAHVKQLGGAKGLALIGSSMGGFFANFFAEQFACPCVLINPAVYPHKLLSQFIGSQKNPYTGAEYVLTAAMMQGLKAKIVSEFRRPNLRMVLLQQGDEVLDYREAAQLFAEQYLIVEQGGDHSFVQFERWLPKVGEFLRL